MVMDGDGILEKNILDFFFKGDQKYYFRYAIFGLIRFDLIWFEIIWFGLILSYMMWFELSWFYFSFRDYV